MLAFARCTTLESSFGSSIDIQDIRSLTDSTHDQRDSSPPARSMHPACDRFRLRLASDCVHPKASVIETKYRTLASRIDLSRNLDAFCSTDAPRGRASYVYRSSSWGSFRYTWRVKIELCTGPSIRDLVTSRTDASPVARHCLQLIPASGSKSLHMVCTAKLRTRISYDRVSATALQVHTFRL